MPTYRFTITGIRHHDFRGRLDELYEPALGKRMSISVEHDNPQEPDAVIVYWGRKWVGYVRSGKDREQAYSLIKASGRGSLLGRIADYDRENRWLWLEVSTDCAIAPTCEDKTNVLTNWSFDGETLPTDEEEVRLHAMLCNLEMTIENREPWDDDMEEWLEYVGQNLWRDISCETSGQVRYILELLTAGSTEHKVYAHAADRLQYAIDYMGSPEVRRLQAEQIMAKAHSMDMQLLLLRHADSAKETIGKLPQELVDLFLKDGEVFMGRLWYLHRPYKQVQAIKTLLAMMVRLRDDNGEDATSAITKQWLMAWAANQKDKHKSGVVHEIISTFELQRTNPTLALQLAEMQDECNEQKSMAENTKKLIETIQEQKPMSIQQLNLGNGIQNISDKALEDTGGEG